MTTPARCDHAAALIPSPPGNAEGPLGVTITDTARAAVSRLAAAADDGRETGGILLGHQHRRPRPVLDVVHAGDAGPRAVHQPDSFRRDVSHAQAVADLAYRTDRSIWLGEWHTHPGGPPQPSRRDLASYRRLLRDPELELAVFLTVIVLPDTVIGWQRPRPAGWLVTATHARPVPLLRRISKEITDR
jgi:integrative and conjugative element protein (TIGR02256 family)